MVVLYDSNETNKYLLITEVVGVNASDNSHSSNVPLLINALAMGLRMIHSVNRTDCPFNYQLDTKIDQARERVNKQLVDEADFDEVRKGQKAVDLFGKLLVQKPTSEDLVFTHGDYCLPNIIIHENIVSGFIDWGRAGLADKYQDIALVVRSITRNFGGKYTEMFLEKYGDSQIDRAKIEYYQILDEFF